MGRNKVIQKRQKRQESESSGLFQNNHISHPTGTVDVENIKGPVAPFARIIGNSQKEPRSKKRKRSWIFVDED